MKNYKITVRYDGTRYNGWQRQGNTSNTIQAKIEDILSKMTGHAVEIHGSGRTDKGVHALMQVANFKIKTEMLPSDIMEYINRYLPDDIGIIDICEEDMRFHSRLNVKSKTYVYRVWNSSLPNVFEHRYAYEIADRLDENAMKIAAEYLKGTHDFRGFSSLKRYKKSTIRTIYNIDIIRDGNEIRFVLKGNGFLYNMVRIMVGTLVEVGLGKRVPESVLSVFESGNRVDAGETMPAKGLFLTNVSYEEE